VDRPELTGELPLDRVPSLIRSLFLNSSFKVARVGEAHISPFAGVDVLNPLLMLRGSIGEIFWLSGFSGVMSPAVGLIGEKKVENPTGVVFNRFLCGVEYKSSMLAGNGLATPTLALLFSPLIRTGLRGCSVQYTLLPRSNGVALIGSNFGVYRRSTNFLPASISSWYKGG
jgi:hypothetical protein